MAYNIWFDPSIKATASELLAMVPEADRPLVTRWMHDEYLTDAEQDDIKRILAALRLRMGLTGDRQVRYRWVDEETGEVDGPVY